jgi:DNA-binding FadR family transcriptional regulator
VAKKMGEVLAERIEREILDSGGEPGTHLGGELDLIQRYGSSRAVFREAIRLLERHGIVEMRRGVGGGLYIRRPDPEPVANAMAVYLDFNGVQPRQLEEARRAIETVCVESLARDITDEAVEKLRTFLVDEQNRVEAGEVHSMHDFHILVAALTGNPALELFVDSLTNLTRRQRTSDERNAHYLDQVHHAHSKIAEAIIGRDPSLAVHRMISHLGAVSSAWERRDGQPAAAVAAAD